MATAVSKRDVELLFLFFLYILFPNALKMSSVLYKLLLKMLIYIIKCLVEHVIVTTDSHVCFLCERLGACCFTVLKIYFNSTVLRTLSTETRGGRQTQSLIKKV